MVLVKIVDIAFKPLLYPRKLHEQSDGTEQPFYVYAYKMARDMRAGSILPPITLAKLNGENVLIDGYNRMLAHKQNDKTEIEAEFIEVANEDEAYVQAIRRNIAHGNNLNDYELAKAAVKLQDEFKHSELEVAQILNIPPLELKKITNERVVTTSTGNKMVLKGLFTHQKLPATMSDDQQEIFAARSQLHLCKQFSQLLESGLIQLENHAILDEVNKIFSMLQKIRRY
jgi:ParB-like chromosome segregation protein Spo0J